MTLTLPVRQVALASQGFLLRNVHIYLRESTLYLPTYTEIHRVTKLQAIQRKGHGIMEQQAVKTSGEFIEGISQNVLMIET